MFKIISAEIKKMLAKPGIYVLSVLLAIVLIMGIFIYNPVASETNSVALKGSTFLEYYDDFYGNGSTTGLKIGADTTILTTTNQVLNYRNDILTTDSLDLSNKPIKEQINTLKSIFDEKYDSFREFQYLDESLKTEDNFEVYQNNLTTSLNNLISAVNKGKVLYLQKSYIILTTEQNNNDFDEICDNLKNLFSTSTYTSADEVCSEFENTYENKFNNILNNFIYPDLSEQEFNQFTETENSKLYKTNLILNSILTDIEGLKQQVVENSELNNSISLKNDLATLINEYIGTVNTYKKLVDYTLLDNAFSAISVKQEMDLLGLKDQSQYNTKNLLVRYTYLFDNNKTENDYALPLSIGITSNSKTNAYDYSFFITKVFSFILIVFAVMKASQTISGELKDGTIRYLSIRPINRTKLLFGKFFSIIFMSSILLIFSAVISLIVGGFVFGFETSIILSIFNGTTAIVLHPIVMLLISLFSILLEILVYTSLAILLSCIVKSDLFSLTLMLVVYLLNILFPLFVGANSWLNFYPFSHISLYSMFGSSIYQSTDNIINSMFATHIFGTTNMVVTSVVTVLLIALPLLLANYIFKKKEL